MKQRLTEREIHEKSIKTLTERIKIMHEELEELTDNLNILEQLLAWHKQELEKL